MAGGGLTVEELMRCFGGGAAEAVRCIGVVVRTVGSGGRLVAAAAAKGDKVSMRSVFRLGWVEVD